MASRKEFFAATAASVGALMTPSPQASPTPTPAPPSSAREFALRMRAFDPQLSDTQIDAIASGIEANWKLGDTINHKGETLKNSDEPLPPFSAS